MSVVATKPSQAVATADFSSVVRALTLTHLFSRSRIRAPIGGFQPISLPVKGPVRSLPLNDWDRTLEAVFASHFSQCRSVYRPKNRQDSPLLKSLMNSPDKQTSRFHVLSTRVGSHEWGAPSTDILFGLLTGFRRTYETATPKPRAFLGVGSRSDTRTSRIAITCWPCPHQRRGSEASVL